MCDSCRLLLWLERNPGRGSSRFHFWTLLFLVYINDLLEYILCKIFLFADDTSLMTVAEDPMDAALTLRCDLSTLSLWSNQWRVSSKTEVLTISNKTNQTPHPPLFLNDVQHHSHLGLTLSNNMSWDTHIGFILRKASRTLNVIKALKFKLPRQTLSKLYCTMIRPILEYANVVFDNMPSHLSDALERFQCQAGLVCSGALHGTSRVAVLQVGLHLLRERKFTN